MSQYLVIVESPAKAKTIAKFLGKKYKVDASMGHVRDLPKSQMGVDIENGFQPKYITIRGKSEIINKLKKQAKSSDGIFLATDPDREGEAISWHLAYLLGIDDEKACRITFNEITENAVKNAIKNARKIDKDLVDAQQARRVLDRIVGYKLSPLLWRKVRKGLSAGRVQSVATRLIVDREEEIEKFVPEEYWEILALLSKKGKKTTFEAKFYGTQKEKIKLANEQQVKNIVDEIKDEEWKVAKVKKGEKRRNPSAPFITSTLQQDSSRKLGFPARKTMMVAQQLYEGVDIKGKGSIGLITYMRTDSVRVSNEALQQVRAYIVDKYGEKYVPKSARPYKNKSASQNAHEAVRPTHIELTPDKLKDSLSKDQLKLYKLIWERFVASQMAAAVYDTLQVDIAAGKYMFRASGSKVKFPGFMTVYIEGRDEKAEEKEQSIPELTEGEGITAQKLEPKQYFTQPPARYTEATLVKTLEEKGIGRPSTYAPIISTITARGYVVIEKKYLAPTELGRIVTDVLKKHFSDIVDVSFTANMEKELDEVEEGTMNWLDVLSRFYSPFDDAFKDAEQNMERVKIEDEVSDVQCEKCGQMMVIKQGRFGKFLACPGFPECRNTKTIKQHAGVDCPKCGKPVLVKKSRKGLRYYGCENNPECDFMIWDMPTKDKCPKCGSFLAKKTGKKPVIRCVKEECGYVKQ